MQAIHPNSAAGLRSSTSSASTSRSSSIRAPFTAAAAYQRPAAAEAGRPRRAREQQRQRRRAAPGEAPAGAEPTVSVTFLVADKDRTGEVEVAIPSGEQLRAAMLDNKVDLYTTWGKVWSCGGVGQCGTCIVKVVEGADVLSERTDTEERKLRGKPAEWRLACQTIVGDGENTGRVVIATKPQQK